MEKTSVFLGQPIDLSDLREEDGRPGGPGAVDAPSGVEPALRRGAAGPTVHEVGGVLRSRRQGSARGELCLDDVWKVKRINPWKNITQKKSTATIDNY